MRKLLLLLFSLVLVLGMSACSTSTNPPAADEPSQETTPIPTPEELQGLYHEEIAGRASLQVSENQITIEWSNSAFEHTHTEMTTSYDAEKNAINYTDGVMTTTTYTSETEFTEREDYNNGTGYFEILDERLVWHNDLAEDYDVVIFAKNEEIPEEAEGGYMPNPWVFTTDLQEAITVSGVEFDPPIPEALPKGFELVTYGANINGIISAEYQSEDRTLIIRKSDLYNGQVLSGDYNQYPENWQQVLKGLAIDCYGSAEKINLACFGTENLHFTIGCYDISDAYIEGNGLTIDEISSLIMGMQ